MEIPSKINRIHLIAVCGTGMGSLAGLLKEKGFEVSGSDQNTYPPMSTELENLGVKLYQGYKPENLSDKPDLIIVGNAVSKNNPEVVEMLRLNIPYLSMPEALSKLFITGRKSVVVAGTHGKTTTTALLAHLLLELKSDPSFLIGGILQAGEKNYRLARGPYFAIEGDEYDTAFFDKGPKFLHYQPYYALITSLEFDHADIYRDLDHLASSFEALLSRMNPQGFVLACNHYPRLNEILSQSKAPAETYGFSEKADWSGANLKFTRGGVEFDILAKGKKEITLQSPLAGQHNALNTLACYAFLRKVGFEAAAIQKAIVSFKGVKRRQEVRGVVGNTVVIDDFAHHPTAVLETIDAVRNKYPGQPLWAVFEPRSNTSKRAIFQEQYAASFAGSDQVILSDVFMPEKVVGEEVLNVDVLVSKIQKNKIQAVHLSGVDAIIQKIVQDAPSNAVVLIMSNGGFGGIHDKLLKALHEKK